MTKKVIAIVGASATGKSTVESILEGQYGLKRAISCTTRPMRDYETDGIHYFFVTEQDIDDLENDGLLVEKTVFNGWTYALTNAEFEDCDIVVIEPSGLRQIIDNVGRENVYVVFLTYPDELRKERCIKARGDKDLAEVERRFEADKRDMAGMEQVADITIYNENSQNTAFVIKAILDSLKD